MTAKERFLKYIAFSTASSEESESSPSSERQLELGRALRSETPEAPPQLTVLPLSCPHRFPGCPV